MSAIRNGPQSMNALKHGRYTARRRERRRIAMQLIATHKLFRDGLARRRCVDAPEELIQKWMRLKRRYDELSESHRGGMQRPKQAPPHVDDCQ